MDSSVRVLDCTLRDGAYLVNKDFGQSCITGITNGLINAGIDIVEVGFFQNDEFGEGKTVYKNSEMAKKYVPQKKNGVQYSVLADFSRYDINNLDDYDEDSIDIIRACFFKNERYEVIDFCKKIIEKGYKCFIQPVDILGYTDFEILELLDSVNKIRPFCFSIVDTFGSMYEEDLKRLYELINYNLFSDCFLGFHSHNNLQMSGALTQCFIRMSQGTRTVVVDATLAGMGRGAGNTPTELVAQYLNQKYSHNYNMDEILDLLDTYIDSLRYRCSWGYTTQFFVAGTNSSHVNNILVTKKRSGEGAVREFIEWMLGSERLEDVISEILEKQKEENDDLNG